MKAIVLSAKQLKAIPAETKETKRGPSEYREFRLNGMFGNFWGPITEDEYEFVFTPRDANKPELGGVLRHQSQRAVHEVNIAENKVVVREAKPIQQPSLLKLLMAKKPVATDVDDEDEDEEEEDEPVVIKKKKKA